MKTFISKAKTALSKFLGIEMGRDIAKKLKKHRR